MDAAFDDRDLTAIMSAVFDMRVNLDRIADDARAIRLILEDGDEEEEEADDDGPPDA
jgi:hypothetical protein